MEKRRVTVIGAGSWGTALAHHLTLAGCETTVTGLDSAVLEEIATEHRNSQYHPGLLLAEGIQTEKSLEKATSGRGLIVISTPSQAMRIVAKQIKPLLAPDALVVSTSKGLENQTHKTMSDVLFDELGTREKIAVLSGPSFSREVLLGLPTAVIVAAKSLPVAEKVAGFFHFNSFRVYTSQDVIGVELGGAIKNVIAIAAGIVDGAQMGANARAALITRGLAEMQRLVEARGGERSTVMGLSGLGDLLLTATGDLSRNRRVGIRLAQGEDLDTILASVGQVVEGVEAVDKILHLAQEGKVSMPIVEEIARLLAGMTTVNESVRVLLGRAPKEEKN